jgi:hypothetical protein
MPPWRERGIGVGVGDHCLPLEGAIPQLVPQDLTGDRQTDILIDDQEVVADHKDPSWPREPATSGLREHALRVAIGVRIGDEVSGARIEPLNGIVSTVTDVQDVPAQRRRRLEKGLHPQDEQEYKEPQPLHLNHPFQKLHKMIGKPFTLS